VGKGTLKLARGEKKKAGFSLLVFFFILQRGMASGSAARAPATTSGEGESEAAVGWSRKPREKKGHGFPHTSCFPRGEKGRSQGIFLAEKKRGLNVFAPSARRGKKLPNQHHAASL